MKQMLSKQLQDQIIEEGKERMEGWHDKMKAQVAKNEYELGAEKYAALYEAAIARAERAERALKDFARQIKMHCNKMGIRSVVIQCIANRMEELDITETLTPKTDQDELHKEP